MEPQQGVAWAGRAADPAAPARRPDPLHPREMRRVSLSSPPLPTRPQRPGVPWRTDRPLDRRRAWTALAATWPALGRAPLAWLGAGWDCDAWAVGAHRVALFPRRRAEVVRLRRAAAVLGRAALPLWRAGVRTPEVLGFGRPCPAFPHSFLLVRRVPGVVATEAPAGLVDEAGLARDLGRALSVLHAVTPPVTLETETSPLPGWAAFAAREAARIVTALPEGLSEAAAPWLAGHAGLPPAYSGSPVLVHGDLGAEHLVLGPARGRLSGIVDFGDVLRGDPAVDLAPLGAFFGWPFAARVRRHYTAKADPGLETRTVALARALALVWLGESVQFDDRTALPRLRAAAARAFAPADVLTSR